VASLSIEQQKKELRTEFRYKRKQLSKNVLQQLSESIKDRLLALDVIANSVHINCFVGDPNRNELNTLAFIPALLELGKLVSVPIMKDNYELDLGLISSSQDLVKNKWGILEPKLVFNPDIEPDVIIVPMLAADLSKNRIGYGAGYYDRFLNRFRDSYSIGIVPQSFIFKKLPTDIYDIPLDIILTESSIIE
jgi:5-formyltetrahydrofolate cyclo-ligase